MRVTIEITADDITCGLQRSCYDCPTAMAFARSLPVFCPWLVDGRTAMGNGVVCELPPDARAWILRFDEGRLVEPLPFEALLEN